MQIFQFSTAVAQNIVHGDLVMPYVYYVIMNALPVMIGSLLVTYVEPVTQQMPHCLHLSKEFRKLTKV